MIGFDATTFMALHELLDAADIRMGPVLEDRVKALIAERDRAVAQLAERSKQTDYARILALLDEDRNDIPHMLADAAADSPDETIRKKAPGWMWLASGRKWPTERAKGWYWYEGDDGTPRHQREDSDRLPARLRDILSAESESTLYPTTPMYASSRAALEAVVDVIAEGKWKPNAKE